MRNVDGQHAIDDTPCKGCKFTIQTEPGGGQNFYFVRFVHLQNFAPLIVIPPCPALNGNKTKPSSILLIKFVYQSFTNKQNLNFLKSTFYKIVFHSRSKIMKMLLTSENFEDFLRHLV